MKFSILTLNLHSYQEMKIPGDSVAQRIQKHKPLFDNIAAAVIDLDIDIICLQEVAEPDSEQLTEPYGQGLTNAAQCIKTRIESESHFHIYQDWSHYAWDTWREGVAILSKYPLRKTASRYVTHNKSKHYWKSRNIIMAQIAIPNWGSLNIFSVHMGWWKDAEEPFSAQFDTLKAWANAEDKSPIKATFLCGDFNIAAAGPGYQHVTTSGEYVDQYILANPDGMHDATIGGEIDGWENGDSDRQRIDYIFQKAGGGFKVLNARIIFNKQAYGRVSDHAGLYAQFNLDITG